MSVNDEFKRQLKDLRISLLDNCNLRCSYCMPVNEFSWSHKFDDPKERLTIEDINTISKVFSSLGTTKIRLTGGEPLIRNDINEIIKVIKENQDIKDIALTTNGTLLAKKASGLFKAGLSRLTVSLDTLNPTLAQKINGKNQVESILEGIDAAKEAGFKKIKINSVIQKNINDDEIIELIEFAAAKKCIIRFIELMDVGTANRWSLEKVLTAKEMIEIIQLKYKIKPVEQNYQGEVANRYLVEELNSEIGFITSISKPFCHDCTRARITANGKLYTCLFSSNGYDLKPHLSDPNSLKNYLIEIWQKRNDQYSQQRHLKLLKETPLEMYKIGG